MEATGLSTMATSTNFDADLSTLVTSRVSCISDQMECNGMSEILGAFTASDRQCGDFGTSRDDRDQREHPRQLIPLSQSLQSWLLHSHSLKELAFWDG